MYVYAPDNSGSWHDVEMTVEPITVWAAFGTFVLGMVVGVVMVLSEVNRARRRWREANRKWHEIEAVAVELRNEHDKSRQHEVPDTAGSNS